MFDLFRRPSRTTTATIPSTTSGIASPSHRWCTSWSTSSSWKRCQCYKNVLTTWFIKSIEGLTHSTLSMSFYTFRCFKTNFFPIFKILPLDCFMFNFMLVHLKLKIHCSDPFITLTPERRSCQKWKSAFFWQPQFATISTIQDWPISKYRRIRLIWSLSARPTENIDRMITITGDFYFLIFNKWDFEMWSY